MDIRRKKVLIILSITAGLFTGTLSAQQSALTEPTANDPALISTLPEADTPRILAPDSHPPVSIKKKLAPSPGMASSPPADVAIPPSVRQPSVIASEGGAYPTSSSSVSSAALEAGNASKVRTVDESPSETTHKPAAISAKENPSSIKPLAEPNHPVLVPTAPKAGPSAEGRDGVDHVVLSPSESPALNPPSISPEEKGSQPVLTPGMGKGLHVLNDTTKVERKIASAVAVTKFTPSQQAEIEKIISEYLVSHPEILVKAGETLRAQEAARQKVAMAQAAFENYTELTTDADTPSYGPADAKVVVVTFFDYQSVWSQRLAYEIDRVMKSNPDVRVSFKEWPVLGGRWPASVEAARTGLQIWYQKGPNAYLDYYRGLFAIGHTEGKLTTADIRQVSTEAKLNGKKTKDVDGVLERNDILSHKIGFSGTPAVLVMPAVGGDVNTITVFPGYPSEGELQTAVKLAREGKH